MPKPEYITSQLDAVLAGTIVLVDTREQAPFVIQDFQTQSATLPVGDYGVKGFSDWDNPQFIVERKTRDDLVASLTVNRKRFLREIEKMRQFRFRALLIEGTEDQVERGEYESDANPVSIIQSLGALQVRSNVHVIYGGTAEGCARVLERLVRQHARGILKELNRLRRGVA